MRCRPVLARFVTAFAAAIRLSVTTASATSGSGSRSTKTNDVPRSCSAVDQPADEFALASLILVETCGEQQDAPIARKVLNRAMKRGRERVADIVQE